MPLIYLLTARYIMHVGLTGSKMTRTGSEIVEGIRVRPNTEGPGRGGTGRWMRRRTPFAGLIVVIAGVDTTLVPGPGADAGGTRPESQLHRSPAGRRPAAAQK